MEEDNQIQIVSSICLERVVGFGGLLATESNVKPLVRTRCGFRGLCWIRGRGSPGSGAYLRGISGFFLTMGMAGAAIMMGYLVKGIGPAAGTPRFPGHYSSNSYLYSQQDFVNG